MKLLLAVSIIVAVLNTTSAASPSSSPQLSPPATWAIAREKFEFGPLSLEFRVRTTQSEGLDDSTSPVSRISLNTDFSTSLDPLSIRAIIVLNLQTNSTGSVSESANSQKSATQKALPFGRAFAVA